MKSIGVSVILVATLAACGESGPPGGPPPLTAPFHRQFHLVSVNGSPLPVALPRTGVPVPRTDTLKADTVAFFTDGTFVSRLYYVVPSTGGGQRVNAAPDDGRYFILDGHAYTEGDGHLIAGKMTFAGETMTVETGPTAMYGAHTLTFREVARTIAHP